MAKNKADLFALINTNIQDNTTKDITAAEMREVETQNADSALNVLEPSAQTVAGPVNFAGDLKNAGFDVLVGVTMTEVLRGYSTALVQEPTTVGSAIQIEFGAAQKTASDPVMLAANGAITVNQSGAYIFRTLMQLGRSGASGVSYLTTRTMKGATQFGISQTTGLSSTSSVIPKESSVLMNLLAGDVVTLQLIRDASGANAGGLYAKESSHGWVISPTALIVVSKVSGISV